MSDIELELLDPGVELELETAAVVGPAGPPGSSSAVYEFFQPDVQEDWGPIHHNLGKHPLAIVMPYDRSERIEAAVTDVDKNTCYVHVNPPMSGWAELS
jgi:hypothetical protein